MGKIYGNIVKVGHMLNKNQVVMPGDKVSGEYQLIEIKENKEYVIPFFQREIRWKEKNVIELLTDVKRGKIFLGNIVINEKTIDNKIIYEIIDGQQRFTVIRMILRYIYKSLAVNDSSYIKKLNNISKMSIESFSKFNDFENNDYSLEKLDDAIKKEISDSDRYKQKERYTELWNFINNEQKVIKTPQEQKSFLENLISCDINLILTVNDENSEVISNFIDINQKGIKLDTEDTFKGYLFKYVNGNDIHDSWCKFKENCIAIKSMKDYFINEDVLLQILEQYIYCNVLSHRQDGKLVFSTLKFKQDFTLTSDFDSKIGFFMKGAHLLQVLNGNFNLTDMFIKLVKITDLIKLILEDRIYPTNFKNNYFDDGLFIDNNRISEDNFQLIYTCMRNILLSINNIPKILIIKYIDDIILNDEVKNICDNNMKIKKYNSIFTIYIYAILFNLCSPKKEKTVLYDIFKETNWIEKVNEKIEDIIKNKTFSSIVLKYKESNYNSDDIITSCKMLATLFNFTVKKDGFYTISDHKYAKEFLLDINTYSREHYFINNSGKFIIRVGDKKQKYPKEINGLKKSIFNFIFLPGKINNNILDDYLFTVKNDLIVDKISKENLELDNYTKKIIEIIQEDDSFKKLKHCDSNKINDYYLNDFSKEFTSFTSKVTDIFFDKLSKL